MVSPNVRGMSTSTVVVHGATGTQGAALVRRLLAAGHQVRAVARRTPARNPHPRTTPVVADLLDVDALVVAYAGADAVVVQLPLAFAADTAVPQARAVLDALRKAGVPRAVFNAGTALAAEPVGVPFVDARVMVAAELADAVPCASVVGPASTYMENIAAPWSWPLVREGQLAYPLPAALPNPWLALADLGEAVVDLLSTPVPPPLRVVAGPQALTGDEAAAELGLALERPERWRTVEPAEYERMLAPHLGPEVAAGVAAAYAPPPPSAPRAPAPDPAVVRTGTTTLRDWAARQIRSAHGR
jgi:uncharacterized protein YbjT (DUF2867 family)